VKPASKRRSWIAVGAGLEHLGYADTAAGRRKFLADAEGLVDRSRLIRAGINQPDGASLQVTVERSWCFGSEEFREKMSLLVGDVKDDTGTAGSKANGYSGSQTNDHEQDRLAQGDDHAQHPQAQLGEAGLDRQAAAHGSAQWRDTGGADAENKVEKQEAGSKNVEQNG